MEESWCEWGVSRLIRCGVLGATNRSEGIFCGAAGPPSIGPKRHVITPFTQRRQALGYLLRVKMPFNQPLPQSFHHPLGPGVDGPCTMEDSDIEVYGLTKPALHQTEHRAFINLIVITC